MNYIGKIVKLTILNGYYYKGKVTNVSEEALTLIDIRQKMASLSPKNIITIEEVLQ